MTGTPLQQVVHAYGVVSADFRAPLPTGLGDAAVEVVTLAGLGVLVSRLDAGSFGEAVWQLHGTDPAWVEPVAEQHHRVLQAAVEQGDVLPLRLPGIYADTNAVEAVLDGQLDVLRVAFARVRGRVELGAKAFALAEPEQPEAERPASGRDYLLGRAAAGARREQARDRANAAVAAAHERISALAASAVTNPPQDTALSGRREPMLLNAAYLVPRASLDDVVELVETLGADLVADGVALEVSGPWPPYNFVAEAEITAAGADL
ncbi:MAG TPA: GvpL/GvpF family gas vesicle protein [Propionibacteriaceae bacterium]|nr:GvpL/GvpF family gas vesicle protein [Propionibacteriaceae bacterium]